LASRRNSDLSRRLREAALKPDHDVVSRLLADLLPEDDLIGSLWRPSPRAMKALWKGWPSTVPATFTKPPVPKNEAESGQTTKVQPPRWGLFSNVAVKVRSIFSVPCSGVIGAPHQGRRWATTADMREERNSVPGQIPDIGL
jgi:hypothetical protein